MLWNEILRISNFIVAAFLHIWPYLVVTIPLAVAVQMSGASKYIRRVFQAKPLTAILLATVVGAFSPFCSCGVIPVIASLLISGVPLAPVMSFWIASPSMDPEIFFLSVGMIGWELAVGRLIATFLLSLSAGLITLILMKKGWLGQKVLQSRRSASVPTMVNIIKYGYQRLKYRMAAKAPSKYVVPPAVPISTSQRHLMAIGQPLAYVKPPGAFSLCTACASEAPNTSVPLQHLVAESTAAANEDCCGTCSQDSGHRYKADSFRTRLIPEILDATWMIGKFMALAFLLEGLIALYVPEQWIGGLLGSNSPLSIIIAALLGVPAYTTNLTALPLISGLLTQGMNPAAALAFLIAGPVTTLPAMGAVWPLVARRVFVFYVSLALVGAVLIGYIYSIIAILIR